MESKSVVLPTKRTTSVSHPDTVIPKSTLLTQQQKVKFLSVYVPWTHTNKFRYFIQGSSYVNHVVQGCGDKTELDSYLKKARFVVESL
jgi:hypothetical protein